MSSLSKVCVSLSILFSTSVIATEALAAEPASDNDSRSAEEFERSLTWQNGTVKVGGDIASLSLSPEFRYLNPAQSKRVLRDAWGNPDTGAVLGMIFPSDVGPTATDSWGVVITFSEDGYVDDKDAESINYDDLLKNMKEETVAENDERVADGYDSIELVGWAEPPHYDKQSHKLYWAQNLKFGGNEHNTLNYNIRVLGRRGVLVLNAVSSLEQKDLVAKKMQSVLKMVNFNDGHRYADFVPGTDKVAAYGIGALILGKVALKVGLFKGLLAALIAAKKLILVALIGFGSWLKSLFRRKQVGESSLSGTVPPPPPSQQ